MRRYSKSKRKSLSEYRTFDVDLYIRFLYINSIKYSSLSSISLKIEYLKISRSFNLYLYNSNNNI